ncbi:MAG TPA: hypothetical protein VK497_03560 [Candidatus Saccharimonadales bacterium]|nr:hypothetical protein [Candidatus Saccharimonadales bacterium]
MQKHPRFLWLREHPRWVYVFVAIGLLLMHMFIFRDVIAAIPSVLKGDASIVREELVPFFDFGSQFWGEGTSALTSSEEVRVSYSFWTAWMRQNMVLPFAIILLNTLSAFILFYAFHRIGRYIYKRSLFGIMSALLAAIVIHTILLYAKMAHFYVLIIGFSMFALSLSLMCEQLFFKLRITKKNVLAVSALTLFNPAIHYHVIFYVVTAIIMFVHSLLTLVMNRRFFFKYFRRSLLYFTLLVLLSLVPYVIYIYLTSSSSIAGVSTQIPVNYWMIYYASLSLPFIFSLDTAGHLDLIRYGNYLAPIPRFGSTIVMFLIGGLFLFKRWKTTHIVVRVFLVTIFIVMLFAMWMTLGYSENGPYSFHKVFGDIAIFFSNTGGVVGSTIASLMSTFINILRFPHRFQFIYFYAAGLLFMVALYWLRLTFMRRFRPIVATTFVILIALFPIIASNDYRTALTSGDLATFVSPYRIPDDLKNIKQKLASENNNRLFILPTLESGREIKQDGKRYSFLDKYLIYYLNQPTFYYGAGANTENKLVSYLAYRAIAYNEKWWQDILANNLGITDIVVPVQAVQREKGISYLPGIEGKIQKSLLASSKYEKTYSGKDYSLYSLKQSRDTGTSTLIDMQWQNTLEYLNREDKPNDTTFFPLQIAKFLQSDARKKVMTDSVERSFYDLYMTKATDRTFIPNPISLPFNSEYVASSNFTNNTLSLSTLYAKDDDYNYLHENVPSLMNLQRPSFVGLTKGNVTLGIKLKVPETGSYRLLLHAASKGKVVQASMGGTALDLAKIKDDQDKTGDYVDFSYFYEDVKLEKGTHIIDLKNVDQNAVIVDSITLVPVHDIPSTFDQVTFANLQITPTDKELIYDVRMEQSK